jgi:hypothetical protein
MQAILEARAAKFSVAASERQAARTSPSLFRLKRQRTARPIPNSAFSNSCYYCHFGAGDGFPFPRAAAWHTPCLNPSPFNKRQGRMVRPGASRNPTTK